VIRASRRLVNSWELLDEDEVLLARLVFEPGRHSEPMVEFTFLFDGDAESDARPDMCLTIQNASQLYEALGEALTAAKSHRK